MKIAGDLRIRGGWEGMIEWRGTIIVAEFFGHFKNF